MSTASVTLRPGWPAFLPAAFLEAFMRARTETIDFADPRLDRQLRAAFRRGAPAWARAYEEDILQVVRERLHRAATRHQARTGTTLPLSHQFRLAYTTTVDEVRKLAVRRLEPISGQDAEPDATGPRATSGTPESAAYSREIAAAVRRCLVGLKILRRQATTLYLLGHGVTEAARLLGWTAKRAENMVYRGLADLRACLEKCGVKP